MTVGRDAGAEGQSPMSALRQYGIVRVRKLAHDADHYDGWVVNQRAPAVGDTGTIVEILSASGLADAYVVESVAPDGSTVWLADFAAEEIEPVDEALPSAAAEGTSHHR